MLSVSISSTLDWYPADVLDGYPSKISVQRWREMQSTPPGMKTISNHFLVRFRFIFVTRVCVRISARRQREIQFCLVLFLPRRKRLQNIFNDDDYVFIFVTRVYALLTPRYFRLVEAHGVQLRYYKIISGNKDHRTSSNAERWPWAII